ncbi:MAG: OB-fold domain-containing protein [Deltaproteobacteria bacterium]|nr:OB-fold domain-containing protein [Deltaproteobacteria bacterium]
MGSKRIPVGEGLFDIPESPVDGQALNGSRCEDCGRYFFPTVDRCISCSGENVRPVKLGRKGRLHTYTSCHYPPPGGKYKGPIPYGLGVIALQEGILIQARLSETDTSKLRRGMELSLYLQSWNDGEGNEVFAHAYRPVDVSEF